ncbi:MAG: AAA family ATPase [Elusimicrobiota bacterium]
MNLFPDQQRALELARKNPLFVLTGSAGTGKSTVVRAIIEDLAKPGVRVAIAAPSGKAAKRIAEITGRPATTIHRLLEPQKTADGFAFTRGPSNPIDVDLLVVDEASMIDITLMARLIEAIPPGARLLLVGDPYQLPSVGPGGLLKDILDSKAVASTELTVVKRQDKGLLLSNCHRIRLGQDIETREDAPDFTFIPLRDEADIQAKIIDLVSRELPRTRNLDPMRDIQVLAPLRERTALSCRALNERLQRALNPNPPLENVSFRLGDRVIQLKNDYDHAIFNGDLGRVTRISREDRRIDVLFECPDRPVELDLFNNDLALAYCLTIHKSQGSEWNVVVIPVHRAFGPMMLTRNLFYTGLTRAKRLCILVGHRDEIPRIVRRQGSLRRYTGLAGFLNGKGR